MKMDESVKRITNSNKTRKGKTTRSEQKGEGKRRVETRVETTSSEGFLRAKKRNVKKKAQGRAHKMHKRFFWKTSSAGKYRKMLDFKAIGVSGQGVSRTAKELPTKRPLSRVAAALSTAR
jgi:hypothetical protein